MTVRGYGSEVWCLSELGTGRLVSGRAALAQALYRRLVTPRGTLRGGREESAYGLDVAGYVGAVGTTVARIALPAVVRAELLKDDRVRSVTVSATSVEESGGITLVLDLDVTPHDEDEEFRLTLGVSDVGVSVLGGPTT
ncbi:MAG: hypothetical protein WC372_11150 [Candidatus Neomarinimicrobiota bacterium]